MSLNKYPSLAWCEKYGKLFPESDCVWHKTQGEDARIIDRPNVIFLDTETLAYCPDALEIMEWIWENKHRLIQNGDNRWMLDKLDPERSGFWFAAIEHIEANTWLEVLMQAVELVQEGE